MKKYNLFKILAITIVVGFILTLFIPSSYLDYTGKVVTNNVNSVGIVGVLSNLSISISYFNGIAIFLVAVACLYGLMSKIDLYNRFVSNTATKFKGKERLLVILTIIVFGVLACLVNDPLILIVFVPFIYQVMKALDIDKKIILSSILVAGLIGAMCGIYNKTLFTLLKLELNTLLLVKMIVLVLSLALLIFFTAPKKQSKEVAKKAAKKAKVKEEIKRVATKVARRNKDVKVNKVVYAILTLLFGTIGINKFYARDIKAGILRILFCWTLIPTILSLVEFVAVLTEKQDKNGQIPANSDRRSCVLFGACVVLFVLFTIGAIIPWEALINKFDAFSDFNTWLGKLAIGKYKVFNNIIGAPAAVDATTGSSTGTIQVFGTWALADVATYLFLLVGIIGLCSKVKFNEFIAAETNAIKKILPVALTAMFISIVLVLMVTSGVNITICHAIIKLTKGFNLATLSLGTIVGSIIVGDFYYFTSTIVSVFSTVINNTDLNGVIGLVTQSLHYLTMMIAPTSVGLVIGLYYFNIPFGKWIKYIWKVLLGLFVISIVSAIIVFALV